MGEPGDFRNELKAIFGDRAIFEEKSLKRYATDQLGDPHYSRTPRAVVLPVNTDEVAALMRIANSRRVPVTPRGAGSGLAGAAIPAAGGVVCSFEKMNRILEIDTANLMAVVEPGVITNALDKALEPHGLFFAGYPMSEDICFVGGNVAENAGGGRAVKYGVTSRYILGAEIVSPQGTIMNLGGKRLKDVSGYNLLSLFIGSEGTLGLITRLTIRLIPRPEKQAVLLAGFPETKEAAAAVESLKRRMRNPPSSIEFMDGITARDTNSSLRESERMELPSTAEAYLLIEIDGSADRDLEADLDQAESLIGEKGGCVLLRGHEQMEMDRACKLRKQIPWRVKMSSGAWHSLEDVVVPPASVPELVAFVGTLRERYRIPIALFGHAGDGNFHVTPMKGSDQSPEEWRRCVASLLEELYARVVSLDGSISGEHGIGRKRTAAFERFTDPAALELMRNLKELIDPAGILNPGVIFPLPEDQA